MLTTIRILQRSDWICIGIAVLILTPIINGPTALLIGASLANCGYQPQNLNLAKITKSLLSLSIVGLGFGISINQAIEYSQKGFVLIVGSIAITLSFGYLLAKYLNIEKKTGYLISTGTAICGGSAIAAVAPTIGATSKQISLALATVFVLNACGLFLFPFIGHLVGLNQVQFGYWAAIAIHDTSSVVGAASAYGNEALSVATTVKLARALWIIPVALISALLFKEKESKFKLPYFIAFYLLAIIISNYLPQFSSLYNSIFVGAKQLLKVCLFFIGYGLTARSLRSAGIKPLLLGVLLWLFIASLSLLVISQLY